MWYGFRNSIIAICLEKVLWVMPMTFSEIIRASGGSGTLGPDFRDALRPALKATLVKRGISQLSPRFVGIGGSEGWTKDAFDELTSDCYQFMLERLPSIRAQLLVRANVDPLIFRNIHNFLTRCQQRHDPIGYRVFIVLQGAVRQAVDEGLLVLMEGDPRIRNDTILGFDETGDAACEKDAEEAEPILADQVWHWCDALLPDLVVADRLGGVRARTVGLLSGLRGHGLRVFRFVDLIGPLKKETRTRWTAVARDATGDLSVETNDTGETWGTWWMAPDTSWEARESWGRLIACVSDQLDRAAHSPEERDRLEVYWMALRHFSLSDWSYQVDTGPAPTSRGMSDHLGVSLRQVNHLRGSIKTAISDCCETPNLRAVASR